MKKPGKKKENTEIPNQKTDLKLNFIILIYAVVAVITPNLQTLDSNGPKFLALSIVNLITFLYLLFRKQEGDRTNMLTGFFNHPAGLLYFLLMLISLLSFFKAVNIPESMMVFSKYFTVFTAAIILFLVFRVGTIYFRQMAVIMTVILIIDGFTVFYSIGRYINRELDSIALIKSVYSNKNILASAIFVKISFALWLIIYTRKIPRILGIIGLFAGILATLFMSTRAFYLGLFLLAAVYFIPTLVLFIKNREKKILGNLLIFSGIFIVSVLIYTTTQKFLYPKEKTSGYNTTIGDRLSTIESGNHSIQLRLMSWKNSVILIKENPLLGVGIGNWRVVELKYENPFVPRNNYMLKAHNDFIEITTETGIFGGLVFLGIFLVIFFGFLKSRLKDKISPDDQLILASALGLMCYSLDAFFNFPSDRPEIQVFFAVFLAIGINTGYPFRFHFHLTKFQDIFMKLTMLLVMLISLILLSYNFVSLKYQRVANDEIASGKLKTSSGYFINGFPPIPTLTSEGEPIAVTKSWFLINDGKYRDAIDLVKTDKSSPYNGNASYVIAWSYLQLGMPDSTIYYLKKTVSLMPINYEMTARLSNILETNKQEEEALQVQLAYLERVKDNPEAWTYASALSEKMGKHDQALKLVKKGLSYVEEDSTLLIREKYLENKLRIKNVEGDFNRGKDLYEHRKFKDVIEVFSGIIQRDDRIPEAYEYRAKSYFQLKEYSSCIRDLNKLFLMRPHIGSLINLRGTCHYFLNNKDSACNDFLEASRLGDNEAALNYKKICAINNK